MAKFFFIWQDKVLVKIDPREVALLATEGNYTRIILANRTYFMVRSSLSNALRKLPSDTFIKVHRSYVVSVYHVDEIYKEYLTMLGDNVPIGKQYYQPLVEKLTIIE